MIVFGDIHTRFDILSKIIEKWGGEEMWSLGDLIDGKYGAEGGAKCVRMCRDEGVGLIRGNHEAYPLMARNKEDLGVLWGVEGEEAERHWQEWEDLRNLLSQEDITYLRGGKLYHRVEGAVLAHAKIAIGEGEDREWYDNTKDWGGVVSYGGQWGHAWVGHTRVTKVGRWSYDHLTLLDFDVKQKGVVGVGRVETGEVWEVSEGGVVRVRGGW